jgi:diaminopropionate ammonia-lyase
MQGYTLLLAEILEEPGARPTHVFVQAGVGAFAAAVAAHLWQTLGTDRPQFAVVESDVADCLFRSAQAGHPVTVGGEHSTIMAGLACGEVSLLAWRILDAAADAFVTIGDDVAKGTMRRLYRPTGSDRTIVAGESGAAGLAGLLAVAQSESARDDLGLDGSSTVLVIGTETDTDPESFDAIVGRDRTKVDA